MGLSLPLRGAGRHWMPKEVPEHALGQDVIQWDIANRRVALQDVPAIDCGFSPQATYKTEAHPTVVWASSRAWPKVRVWLQRSSGARGRRRALNGGAIP